MLTQTKRYPYSPIARREKMAFPDGARVAVLPYINIEHFPENLPGTGLSSATTAFEPDVLNYGWRDYGNRIGIWRMMEGLDKYGMRATVCLNGEVGREYPAIIEEGNKRGWEWMGHGHNNSQLLPGMEESAERDLITDVVAAIETTTGSKPKGWLGPYVSETYNTPDLLAEAGIEYLCDFCCDDQPFEMNVKTGSLISMPYSVECNDLPLALYFGATGRDMGQLIRDQFDVLYAEGADNARVLPICLHTFIAGQPFRWKHISKALEYIAGHRDVWHPTGGEVNDWYRANHL
ncbi:MAG: polysaccharide deacetylase family protein [Alphaproteobacteria bacterium]|jgi:peptidoglycan/xylan/chitin deacetylase (PgdA/CDA1 family)|nr:polysaccharide deacetylase family protein [Alphaproteobacteria bacterium]MDP6818441.1 polysaccharide deacetylase family protein [Alphaproteobacteria bacterium]